jgi:hypothetical protein
MSAFLAPERLKGFKGTESTDFHLCGKKQSLLPGICLEGLKGTTKNINQDS